MAENVLSLEKKLFSSVFLPSFHLILHVSILFLNQRRERTESKKKKEWECHAILSSFLRTEMNNSKAKEEKGICADGQFVQDERI
jgi:hypothetical protein